MWAGITVFAACAKGSWSSRGELHVKTTPEQLSGPRSAASAPTCHRCSAACSHPAEPPMNLLSPAAESKTLDTVWRRLQYSIHPHLQSIFWLNSPIIQACLHWLFDFLEGKMITLWKVIVKLKKCWMPLLCKTYLQGYPCYQSLITWCLIPKASTPKAAIHCKDLIVNASSWEKGRRKLFVPAWGIHSILKKKYGLVL